MGEHPVRLIVADDLRRGHGSSFFRMWFALPLVLWLAIWSVVAFLVALANWLLTLVLGRSPAPLHAFLSRYVRFTTHIYAYMNLAAEPLPNFDGKPGYPIDLEIDPPAPQRRLSVLLRIVLALPALLIAGALLGSNFALSSTTFNEGGLIGAVVLLGWFVAVLLGRMPHGLRDAIAYAISYGAQTWAYLLLLTDRYPSSDPQSALRGLPIRSDPVSMRVNDDLRRSRLTVFFRLPLCFVHLVWLTLWAILAYVLSILSWLVTLFEGHAPNGFHRFLAAFVRYQCQVYAYLFVIAGPFPGFTGSSGYPIDLMIAPRARQNRWTVLVRLVLVIPALVITAAYVQLLLIVGVLGWFVSLITGRMPQGLRNAGALALRYSAQTTAYLFLLTDVYPYAGPTAEAQQTEVVPELVVPDPIAPIA
ncbi:MAG TPA: DUF4389 domain-containing protein [Solirubrobacteraceae bacterium]